MLKPKELENCGTFLQVFCRLKLCPIVFDKFSCRFLIEKSPRCRLIWQLQYCLMWLQILFTIVRVAPSLLCKNQEESQRLAWYMIITLVVTFEATWHHIFLVWKPELFVALVNLFMDPTKHSGNDVNYKGIRHNRQELIAMYFPYFNMVSVTTGILVYIANPDYENLLISIFPKDLGSIWIWLLCYFREAWFLVHVIGVLIVGIQCHIIFFEKIFDACRMLERQTESPNDTFRVLRRIHLAISLFNQINQVAIFILKEAILWISVVNGYMAIAHFWENPIMGIMNWILFLDCLLAYGVVYERAFAVPNSISMAKRAILWQWAVNQGQGSEKMKLMKRRMRSIPCWGISVGGFHNMERSATPIFLHFVVSSISGALISTI